MGGEALPPSETPRFKQDKKYTLEMLSSRSEMSVRATSTMVRENVVYKGQRSGGKGEVGKLGEKMQQTASTMA